MWLKIINNCYFYRQPYTAKSQPPPHFFIIHNLSFLLDDTHTTSEQDKNSSENDAKRSLSMCLYSLLLQIDKRCGKFSLFSSMRDISFTAFNFPDEFSLDTFSLVKKFMKFCKWMSKRENFIGRSDGCGYNWIILPRWFFGGKFKGWNMKNVEIVPAFILEVIQKFVKL